MNRRLLPVATIAAIAATCVSITVFACSDKASAASNAAAGKSTVAASSNGACTAAMAAKCTPEMAAACKAKGVSTAAATACPYHNSNAAVTANVAADHCAKGSAAMAASASSACCMSKGAKASAVTASANGACASKASAAMAAGSSCSAHKGAAYDAMTTGGQACGGKGIGAMAGSTGHDCDACADMATCEGALKSAGSQFQVVPLKNGVMYVYTATDAKGVRAVQAAVARRNERVNALVNANGAKLCPDCKTMRGAMASGKLTREIVNIEGGSISLVTSSDPTMVAKLYAMAGLSSQKLVKS